MSLRYTLALITLLLALPCSYAFAGLVPDNETHDFGERIMGEKTTHTFVLRNDGDEVVTISDVRAGCGCTKPTGWKSEVAPGETTEVSVEYENKNRPGPFHKVVRVMHDAGPTLRLNLKGNIRPEVSYEPDRIHWESITRSNPASREVVLTTAMLDSLEITEVTSHNENIVAELIDVPEDPKTKRLKVSVKKTAPLGELHGRVSMRTNGEFVDEISIPISGRVFGDVKVTPEQVRFLPTLQGNPHRVVEITVTDTSNTKGFKVTEVKDPTERLDVNIEPGESPGTFLVTAKFRDTFNEPGAHAGQLEIVTNREGEEKITVNYNGYIRGS